MNAPVTYFAEPRRQGFSLTRVSALVLRYLYLLRSSWPRLAEIIYWPLVQLLMWGFLQLYLNQNSSFFARASGTFIGAVLLWDILVRGQLGFSMSFLEEMWSRNMANILISPVRPREFLTALMVMSVVRLAIGLIPVTLLAIWFFGFNFWSLGLPLVAFFANLLLSAWAVGIFVSGLILRNGMGAEGLAWTIMFLILPLCAVYYPVALLPAFLQPIAWALPPTYVFEGMRSILIDLTFRPDLMIDAFAINIVYMTIASIAFVRLLNAARRLGTLMAAGE